MPGALFINVGTRSTSSGAESRAPSLPSGVEAGRGVLLCAVHSKSNAVHACATSGWSKVGQWDSGGSFTVSLWIAQGGASAPTVTWTGSVACAAQISYYNDLMNPLDASLGASSVNTGAVSTHSSTGFNTTRPESLVVYFDVAAANTSMGTPSGWTEDNDAGSATDAGRHVWGSKKIAASGDASGNISVTGANAAWVQGQVEIMRVAVAGFESDIVELSAWLDYEPGGGPVTRRRQMAVVN